MATVTIRDNASAGWHEFTSPDIPGFYMVAPEEKVTAAYEDIPRAIELLYQAQKKKAVVRLKGIKSSPGAQIRQYAIEITPAS